GNFAWLNFITIALAISAFDNAALARIFPVTPDAPLETPLVYVALALACTALIVFLSYRPARNLLSRRQIMNASFDPFHIVGTYGAFGSITKERFEIVVEGTAEPVLTPQTVWREYEFKGKPGDVKRRPPQFAPYRSEEHTSELQSRFDLVCRLLLEKKKDDRTLAGARACAPPSSTSPPTRAASCALRDPHRRGLSLLAGRPPGLLRVDVVLF